MSNQSLVTLMSVGEDGVARNWNSVKGAGTYYAHGGNASHILTSEYPDGILYASKGMLIVVMLKASDFRRHPA